MERLSADGRICHQQLGAYLNGAYTVLRECDAASTPSEHAQNGGFLLKWGGSTVASEQPQKSADTDTVSAMTARRQAPSRSGNETTDKNYGSVQGTDTVTKDNTSVQGTDSAQVGPVAKTTEIRGNHGSS
ncbi:hypothetical protein PC118_g12915 [Phytophthora cactorum]|uniref:Uncharacterized protein n=1 Tax=Phytophthora cactorum TaxID=29920 RepID=A0A8T1FYP7_9STRA|nr:hypothetical protein PC118_g12915 [Phytophthora cactorum]